MAYPNYVDKTELVADFRAMDVKEAEESNEPGIEGSCGAIAGILDRLLEPNRPITCYDSEGDKPIPEALVAKTSYLIKATENISHPSGDFGIWVIAEGVQIHYHSSCMGQDLLFAYKGI